MQRFTKGKGLPREFKKWQRTVDAMLDGVDCGDNNIYLMVDQKLVKAGVSHRRPGLHVDGYWFESGWGGQGGWNSVSAHRGSGGGHRSIGGHGGSGGHGSNKLINNWDTIDFSTPEALILASDVPACRAYLGEYNGHIGHGGDCSTIDTTNLKEMIFDANNTYIGNVGLLHESLPVSQDCYRTVVRLNVKNWEPKFLN